MGQRIICQNLRLWIGRGERTLGSMPLVSVVLIFLDEETFLDEAVRSVIDQTLTDWELILVDDGSTDDSSRIAKVWAARESRIRYIDHPRHENRGMAASRNFGVANSSAPFLAFMDADDVWISEKLAEQVEVLKAMPDVAMVNGAMVLWYSWDSTSALRDTVVLTGAVENRRFDPPDAALNIYPLVPIDGAGVDLMVRRTVFDEVGGFEERFRGMYEDQSFLIKVFLRYSIYISSRPWILYRQHKDSACAGTNQRQYLRIRGDFLDWLREDVDQLGDPRVSAALRQARRRVRYRKPTALIADRLWPLLSAVRACANRKGNRIGD